MQMLRTILVAFLVLVAAFCADAQSDPISEQGLKPYGAYSGDFDSISMVNGGLYFTIPLLSYPQRGNKLTLDLKLVYMEGTWQVKTTCYQTSCSAAVSGGPGNLGIGDSQIIYESWGGQTGNLNLTTWPTLIDFTFASHPLGQTSVSANGLVYGFESVDATGLKLSGFQSSQSGSNYTLALGVMTDRSGIQYQRSADGTTYSKQDPNGNTINSSSSSGWTDTLGRNVPNPPGGPGFQNPGISTDTGGCQGLFPTADAYLWTVPGPAGGSAEFKVCFAKIPIQTHFTQYQETDSVGIQYRIQNLIAFNGSSWTTSPAWVFEYNDHDPGDPSTVNYGSLTKITFPVGGTVSYTHGTLANAVSSRRAISQKTVNANDGTGAHTWSYSYSANLTTNVVTDPLGNDTGYTLTNLNGRAGGLYPTEVDTYQGSHSGGTPLKSVKTNYSFITKTDGESLDGIRQYGMFGVVPIGVTTIWSNGQQQKITSNFDAGFTFTDPGGINYTVPYGNVIAKAEYDYGAGAPGPLLRTTTTNYQAFSYPAYLAANLLNLPSQVAVFPGTAGTGSCGANGMIACTTYGYDEGESGIHGNQTSVHKWLNTTGGYLVTSNVYNSNGLVTSTTDPKNNPPTIYGYSPTSCPPGTGYAGSGPTSVTNALGQTTYHCYDLNTGLLNSTTDPNNQTTSYTYDVRWRLASANFPDGGWDRYTYQEATFPFSATKTKKIATSQSSAMTYYFDGLGRTSETQRYDTEGDDYTATTYDADGRVNTVYNPTRCNPPTTNCNEGGGVYGATWGYTVTAYDALNRKTLVTEQDGSTISTSYTGNCTVGTGLATTVTDETGRTRQSCTDALGRLTGVTENPGAGGLNYLTTYTYDALDDLIGVVQGGSHNRSFAYDSLRRLTTSTNPETGTVTYGYDADSNVTSKTDARGITVSYAYDKLNRLTGKTYSNGDPAVTYVYDGNAPCGSVGSFNYGLAIGRRTAMCDAGGVEAWSYDSMGRPLVEQRTTGGVTKTTTYTYDFAGDIGTLTYPSGRTITYTTADTGWPAKAVDVADNENYVIAHGCNWGLNTDGVCHTPWGAVSGELLGDASGSINVGSTHQFNNRLQLADFGYYVPGANGIGQYVKLLYYSYKDANGHNNGNVMGITNSLDATRSQTFIYDQVNRITTAMTPSTCAPNCWSLAFTYDQWANLTTAVATGSATPLNLAVNANNRITTPGFTYDASGNLTADVTSTYAWNAESEIKTAAGVNYTYDGDGNRVMKSNGKLYWYGAGTEILEETDATGSMTNASFFEYVYFAGKRVARHDASGNVLYYMQDDLGTTDGMLEINASQTTETVCYDADFYPYGGEKVYTNTCPQNYKFTGKERDSESNLDNFGARYFGSTMGRFMSPDPVFFQASMLTDPQQLNLYAYVRNNPLVLVDPKGETIQLIGDEGERDIELQALQQAVGAKAGSYLYQNAVTTTDSNGNTITSYYVGVYTNGPSGQGPDFGSINSVSGALGNIIGDSRVAELSLAPAGTMVTSDRGETALIGPVGNGTPAATYTGQDGKLHVTLLDPRSAAPGEIPADMMSNRQPGVLDSGIMTGHEFGHVRYEWGGFWRQALDSSNASAVRLENNVRQLRDPNAATRTQH